MLIFGLVRMSAQNGIMGGGFFAAAELSSDA
jgi:hypothetical protein